jgi:hypothetical protein
MLERCRSPRRQVQEILGFLVPLVDLDRPEALVEFIGVGFAVVVSIGKTMFFFGS